MATITTFNLPAAPRWRGRPYHSQSTPRSPEVAGLLVAETGPLGGLRDRNVLAIVDVENLTISARNLGYELDYRTLARRLASSARAIQLHAAFSIEPGETIDVQHMTRSGFTVHTRMIERLADGSKAANSDNVLAFQAGLLVSRARADVVILGSGDGHLVCDLANAIRALPAKRSVWTLSMPGATSARIDCRRNQSIETNIEIGSDVLVPVSTSVRGRTYGT